MRLHRWPGEQRSARAQARRRYRCCLADGFISGRTEEKRLARRLPDHGDYYDRGDDY